MTFKILIIDDDQAVRDAFELALLENGYDIFLADSGDAGLSLFKDVQPDLVYLDLKMPNKDGVTVLREIRLMNEFVPVFIVTAFQKEFMESLNQATADGLAFEVAAKPLNAE